MGASVGKGCLVLALVLVSAGCVQVPGSDQPPGEGADPRQRGGAEPGLSQPVPRSVLDAGGKDGPASNQVRSGPAFAAPLRGFDPLDYEPLDLLTTRSGQLESAVDVSALARSGIGRPSIRPTVTAPAFADCERVAYDARNFALFEAVVGQAQENGTFLSANLAVSDQCGILFEKGYGVRGPRPWSPTYTDPSDEGGYAAHVNEPVPTDQMWKWASVTKPVTSAIIHRMVSQGLIGLDDRVFCPDATAETQADGARCLLNYDPAPGLSHVPLDVSSLKQTITVRHLLRHEGGWDRVKSPDILSIPFTVAEATGGDLPPTLDDSIRFALSQPLSFEPGSEYPDPGKYSNFGFALLGAIIDRWGAKDHLGYLREDLLGPLGVPAADLQLGRSLPEDFDPREAYYPCAGKGPTLFAGKTPDPVCWMYGGEAREPYFAAGGLTTNARAIALFMTSYWVDDFLDEDKGQPRVDYWSFPDNETGVHGGLFPGVSSLAVQCKNGLNFAFITNQAVDAPKQFSPGSIAGAFCSAGDLFFPGPPVAVFARHLTNADPEPEFRFDETESQFKETTDSLTAEGSRLVDMDCYELDGEVHYASVWSLAEGPAWTVQQGLSGAGLAKTVNALRDTGYRPERIGACVVKGAPVFLVRGVETAPGIEWMERHDMTGPDLSDELVLRSSEGWDVDELIGYGLSETRFAAVWVKGSASRDATAAPPQGEVRFGLTAAEYLPVKVAMDDQDLQLVAIDAYRQAGEVLYAAVWRHLDDWFVTAKLSVPHEGWPFQAQGMKKDHETPIAISVA
ncbi:MAG TPA: serine hydrolase [Candidatus Thermoplasmatota archaeon]|nr:serine hydrolase [Candidatus Thermoplasmatota archaeon]